MTEPQPLGPPGHVGPWRLHLCPPHLYQRFETQDFLYDTLVQIAHVGEEDACTDCDSLPDLPYGYRWAERQMTRWRQ